MEASMRAYGAAQAAVNIFMYHLTASQLLQEARARFRQWLSPNAGVSVRSKDRLIQGFTKFQEQGYGNLLHRNSTMP